MLRKSITFETFDGETVTEEHHFHLSKSDLVELEVSHAGGLSGWIQRIVDSEDGKAIMEEFKKLLLMSYGKKSEDGRRFVKNDQMREEFVTSPAYDALFMELVTDAGAASAFVNAIIPKGLEEEVAKMAESTKAKDEAERVRLEGVRSRLDRLKAIQEEEEVAKMQGSTNAKDEAERVKQLGEQDPAASNVFDTNATKILTPAEVREMDADELKSGLATGKYALGQ